MQKLKFVLVTGLSGAGKTEAIRALEDMGYFCIDNLPPALIPRFTEMFEQSPPSGEVQHVAVVCDIRGGQFFDHLIEALEELERNGFSYSVLFLEASLDTLVRRYKETRRRHPLAPEGSIVQGVKEESRRLEQIRGQADIIIDTTDLTPRMLREQIASRFAQSTRGRFQVSVVSFGFRHGIPIDTDLVFDVRFLPNPHYVPSLSPFTGNDEAVKNYVFQWPVTRRFIAKLEDLLKFLLPQYEKEGKPQLVIGIGCTGGQHRSVAIANHINQFARGLGYETYIRHRELTRKELDTGYREGEPSQ